MSPAENTFGGDPTRSQAVQPSLECRGALRDLASQTKT